MKLLDIILLEDIFKTTKIGSDQETGTVTWDVTYTPLLSLDKNMQKMYNDFTSVVKKYPNDPKLEQLFRDFANIKKSLRTHITRKYKSSGK